MSACADQACPNQTVGDDHFCPACRAIITEGRAALANKPHKLSRPLGFKTCSRAHALAIITKNVREEGSISPYTLGIYLDDGRISRTAFMTAVQRGLQQRQEQP